MISIMLRRPQKSPGPSASPEASRSVATRTEIGPVPHRDRSSSAPRSVALRLEIGPVPRRDRSHSGSKSVQFRIEIGRNPHRDRSGRSSHAGSRDRRCGYHGTRTYLCDV